MHFLSWTAGTALTCYVIWEVTKMHRDYPRFKRDVAEGNPTARPHFYLRILKFEWVSALLALVALGFDRAKLTAASLQLADTTFGHWVSASSAAGKGAVAGIGAGLLIGLVGMSIVRLRSRRRAPAAPQTSTQSRWRKLVPDFTALIPVTGRERLLFAAVAVSAGICEEIVFRGWLLFTLHSSLGFTGTALILLAAVLFGLCHLYQGVTGVIGTTLAGALLCLLYIGTGTLLVPIVLHSLIDLRMAILPASSRQVPQGQMQKEPA